MNLFTQQTCDYCGENPGFDPRNPALWNGYKDADTGNHICWKPKCRREHYAKKAKEGKVTYSEIPVQINR